MRELGGDLLLDLGRENASLLQEIKGVGPGRCFAVAGVLPDRAVGVDIGEELIRKRLGVLLESVRENVQGWD
jgi:hypothetical protein